MEQATQTVNQQERRYTPEQIERAAQRMMDYEEANVIAANDDPHRGWKHSYTLKEYKKNAGELNGIADSLAPMYQQQIIYLSVPGYRLINFGMEYLRNEKINPCKDYVFENVRHQLIDMRRKIKNLFIDKGMYGVEHYIKVEHPKEYQRQIETYPHCYAVKKHA